MVLDKVIKLRILCRKNEKGRRVPANKASTEVFLYVFTMFNTKNKFEKKDFSQILLLYCYALSLSLSLSLSLGSNQKPKS